MKLRRTALLAFALPFAACTEPSEPPQLGLPIDTTVTTIPPRDTVPAANDSIPVASVDTPLPAPAPGAPIQTGTTTPAQLIAFARTLIGTPYAYASADPAVGFDCSGFVTYVFNHFGIGVPRSSVEFTNVGQTVSQAASKPGDLVLFTGTDSLETAVGHMGIVVTAPPDSLRFIHATSGKAYGVTVTTLNAYYQKRFVKVVRVFDASNNPTLRAQPSGRSTKSTPKR